MYKIVRSICYDYLTNYDEFIASLRQIQLSVSDIFGHKYNKYNCLKLIGK